MEHSFKPKEFDWDQNNIKENWDNHKVAFGECEEIFLNEPLIIAKIDKSKIIYKEVRYVAYGVTNAKRLLFVVFTLRTNKVRVISARSMNRKERRFLNEESQKTA